jgi:formate dehydrogenase subunit gamma
MTKPAALPAPERRARHGRIMLWSFLAIALGALTLPFGGYLYVYAVGEPVQAASAQQGITEPHVNPRSQYWRAVRDGDAGYTAVPGGADRRVLIQNGGENWRQVRNGPIANIAPWVLAVMLLLIGAYHLLKGPQKLIESPSGRLMERWSAGERLLHWYTAVLFIVLAITGLSLLFGRAALIPVLGLQGFAAYAQVAMWIHNFGGPLFMVGVVLEVITWARFNGFKRYDWAWLKSLGGRFGKDPHPHAGRANAGEKIWFWFVASAGLIGVCVSGLVLDFPNFGQSREAMQIANVVHGSLAVLWIAIAFGHIYLGTLGVEGTLRGMTTGKVSEEWMKEHYDLWYEQVKKGETGPLPGKAKGAPATAHKQPT